MGLASSKVCKQLSQKDLQEGSIPSTPILTPKVLKQEDLDPRSPSLHISRTPLQLLSAANLKVDELKETEFTAVADETSAKSKIVLLGIDPRSPTVEFQRTPIIINVSEADSAGKFHNKNLDRVKQSVIITTPKSTTKQISTNIPPKLLESSPVKAKSDAIKRKSFVGLLETNIDYTETDLDAVIREKNKAKEIQYDVKEHATPNHKQLVTIVEKENIDPRSPTNDFLRTPIQIIKKVADLNLIDVVDSERESGCIGKEYKQNEIAEELEDHNIIKKCVQEICESVHLNSELESTEKHTDILEKVEPVAMPQINIQTEVNKDAKEIESDDTDTTGTPVKIKSAPITPPTGEVNLMSPGKAVKATKSAPVTPPAVNLAADVKEFDKKLTSLIYRDEDIVICPRKVKLKDYDTRSPLRNINCNEPEKKKSSQKLKVKDKKSEYAVSKIPVFKETGRKTEIQCENTPPRNMEKRKVKVRKSHWDNADATLII
ncbi:uncharacterized protein LOC108910819 [Anoplophora glabripennis]|uniref:uncharacterized protein LOC108910819 n=1 Tax=Anoplophora glabripennis TaxID=217634 RepID=UPI0008746942|nr:uncharacterized protein LOC108910819 [Anoplophora glabripennis]